MGPSLGSEGEGLREKEMSMAWLPSEALRVHLARRHPMAWKAGDIDSQPTFRA